MAMIGGKKGKGKRQQRREQWHSAPLARLASGRIVQRQRTLRRCACCTSRGSAKTRNANLSTILLAGFGPIEAAAAMVTSVCSHTSRAQTLRTKTMSLRIRQQELREESQAKQTRLRIPRTPEKRLRPKLRQSLKRKLLPLERASQSRRQLPLPLAWMGRVQAQPRTTCNPTIGPKSTDGGAIEAAQ